MSGTVSRGREARHRETGEQAEVLVPAAARGPRRRGRWVTTGIVVVVAAGAVASWRAGVFSPAASSGSGQQGASAPATAAVARQDISATTPVNATLGYAGNYPIAAQSSGALTWVPSIGQLIHQGQTLFQVDNGTPVVLLYGSVPSWRTLDEGLTGADVTQLNHDLVALGDADSADISALGWDYYSWETQAGVEKLQSSLGISDPSGSLTLGSVVFAPVALRVVHITGNLGSPASGPVLTATSNQHVVTVPLDAGQQSQVKVGDKVTVTLPDGRTTPAVVASVGQVATSSGSGQSATTTIPVEVKLTDPGAAGSLVQAPVTVNITTATEDNALVVPVGALLAQAPGGYAVEVVGPGNARHYVPVTTGIFDDAAGLVQVNGDLTPGQRVVVPAT